MWNEPSDAVLARIPRFYATENTPWREKRIYEHFFLGSSDWYVAEYLPQERIFFCFAILNNDLDNAEWGYTALDELRDASLHGIEVDRDLYWRQRPAGEVERIVAAHERQGLR